VVWQFWGRAARGVLSVFAQGAFSCLRRPLISPLRPTRSLPLLAGTHLAHHLGSDSAQRADAIGLTRGDHASWHSPDHRRGFALHDDTESSTINIRIGGIPISLSSSSGSKP
jgi:hypothetical protein